MTAETETENVETGRGDTDARPDVVTGARRDPGGPRVVLADGRAWTLARPGLSPVLNDVRDRMFDEMAVAKRVSIPDVIQAAWVLLLANYALTDDDLTRLLTGADEKGLVDAVIDAMFGPEVPRRTYTTWVLSAFHANGLDPAKVPGHLVPEVMKQLVETGRAIPSADYVDAAAAAEKRRKLLDSGG